MRFKHFLNETTKPNKPVVMTVDEQEVLTWVRAHASNYVQKTLSKDNVILRGVPSDAEFAVGDTATFKRKSAYSSNFVNSFLETSPRWKDYPSRSSAYICTNDFNTAKRYSKSSSFYLVIPADNAHVGICPEDDFWPSFEIGLKHAGLSFIEDVNELNNIIENLGAALGMSLPQNDSAALHKQLKSITQKRLMTIPHTDRKLKLVQSMNTMEVTNLNDLLEIVLGPELNKFTHTTATKIIGRDLPHEVWVEGKCAFIKVTGIGDVGIAKQIEWLKNEI